MGAAFCTLKLTSFIFVSNAFAVMFRLLLLLNVISQIEARTNHPIEKIKWRGMRAIASTLLIQVVKQATSQSAKSVLRLAYRPAVYEYKITRDYNIIMEIIIAILLSNFSLIKCGPFVNTYARAWARMNAFAAFGICSFLILEVFSLSLSSFWLFHFCGLFCLFTTTMFRSINRAIFYLRYSNTLSFFCSYNLFFFSFYLIFWCVDSCLYIYMEHSFNKQ